MVADAATADEVRLCGDADAIRRMSVAVARVWARVFQGHASWAMVNVVGTSLELYADMLEQSYLSRELKHNWAAAKPIR